MVRPSAHARVHGREFESLPAGEIRRAVEGTLERQRRFPLDTANALRGRLRREHFTIFKKGAKGISYVCAVKRKFRIPGQTFAESIGGLISFVEAHPLVKAGELVKRFLGVTGEAEGFARGRASRRSPRPFPSSSAKRSGACGATFSWLVREGYVTEFIDGAPYAPPSDGFRRARKRRVEREEHDPENFPEAPPSSEEPAAQALEGWLRPNPFSRRPTSSESPTHVVAPPPGEETPAEVLPPADLPQAEEKAACSPKLRGPAAA